MNRLGKQSRDFILFSFILLVFLAIPEEAFAAGCTAGCGTENVFDAVKCRAACFIKEFKSVLYVLGGFGLIGFAFMAIFNKISWKWFSNIAMGLFLIAVMGMFIDYFTSNGDTTVSAQLDYGYDMGSNTSNPGTSGGIGGVDCSKTPNHESCKNDSCSDDLILIGGKCVKPDDF